MINFTVGPVQSDPEIREIGRENVPYFRTPEFSALMKENEERLLKLANAPADSRVVFLTGSGSAAMECAVMNLFGPQDKLIVINGGSFGARFAKICDIHRIPHDEIRPEFGCGVTEDDLASFAGKGYTGLLVNAGETSTGVLYDVEMIGRFCREQGLILVVDAVSSFIADEMQMEQWGVDLVLTGSQKALALPPGISLLMMGPRAIRRAMEHETESLYFDVKDYLKNGERGQTPFTPAVAILIQLHRRLEKIFEEGVEKERARVRDLAADFREKIRDLPLEILTKCPSNAVTSLHPTGTRADGTPVKATEIFSVLKDEYGIWICPSGGDLADYMFRVGHIGYLTTEDNDRLIGAFRDLMRRGIL